MRQLHVATSNTDLSFFYVPSLETVSYSIVTTILRVYALIPLRICRNCKVDPLYAFAFIRTFLDILIEYFGELTAPTLKDNFDIVHQLLEETLDAGGHPLTTSPNALRDIVLPPSLITKILSVTGVSGLSGPSTSNMSAFSSPIPWRKAGIRYNNNEVYFDIVETLDAVVNK
jgi:AP-3 complex subunit mu